jgi:hypothetical protein
MYSLRSTLSGNIDASGRNAILAQLADPAVRNLVIQPEFYETMSSVWHPPIGMGAAVAGPMDGAQNPAANVDAVQLQIQELKSALNTANQERQRLLRKISDNRCPDEKPKIPPKAGPGGRGAPADDAPRDRSIGGGGKNDTVNLVECDKLSKRVRSIDRTIKSIQDELAKLEPQIQFDDPKPAEELKAQVEEMTDIVDIWAHDITVQPGRTYRYRMIVEVYNPLFARKVDLPEAQESLAEQFTLRSAPSEWSQTIELGSWLQVFITQASPPGAGGLLGGAFGQASAEVFRFSNGRWWSARFPVQPGDRIGSIDSSKAGEAGADFRSDWFVLDIVENIDADKDLQSRGWGASVILQSMNNDDVSQRRSPREDATSRELKRLREQVTLANLGGARAQGN